MRKAIQSIYKKLFRKRGTITFSGPFPAWDKAVAASCGYDAKTITDGIMAAMDKVASGKAAMERDGFALSTPQYPHGLLAALLHVAAQNEGRLHVLDFGGSLGTSYFACKPWLSRVRDLRWTVVEQSHFIDIGNRKFADGVLTFAPEIDAVPSPNFVVISGVLMYLPSPYEFLRKLLSLNADMVVIDRTATVPLDSDVITVQHINSVGYQASYPCRLLSRSKLLNICTESYQCLEVFRALDGFRVKFADLQYIGIMLAKNPLC
ncbi:MAG: methyltransferase, TIGR04325 family [Chthoniobacterales bacterium]